MKSLSIIDWIVFILVIVGGINWGLVGIFKFDLVATLFGEMTSPSRGVYTLVGLAAVYLVILVFQLRKKSV